jgi:hypothetical protein
VWKLEHAEINGGPARNLEALKRVRLVIKGDKLTISADEANKEGKGELVREIDLEGFTRTRTTGVASKPTKITNAEELAKAIPDTDKDWRDRIAKQVDFEKEELLFFAWTGSATDMLPFQVEETKKGPVVVFSCKQGRGDEMPRPGFRLYAIAKNWRGESTG